MTAHTPPHLHGVLVHNQRVTARVRTAVELPQRERDELKKGFFGTVREASLLGGASEETGKGRVYSHHQNVSLNSSVLPFSTNEQHVFPSFTPQVEVS